MIPLTEAGKRLASDMRLLYKGVPLILGEPNEIIATIELEAVQNQSTCCDYACYEDPGCSCDGCELKRLSACLADRDETLAIMRSNTVDRRAEIAILITALSDRNKVIQQQRDALKNKVSTSEIYCEGCALSIAIQTGSHSGGSNE